VTESASYNDCGFVNYFNFFEDFCGTKYKYLTKQIAQFFHDGITFKVYDHEVDITSLA